MESNQLTQLPFKNNYTTKIISCYWLVPEQELRSNPSVQSRALLGAKSYKSLMLYFKNIFYFRSFSYLNSLLATIFLTLERCFYITRPFGYKKVTSSF